MAILKHNRPGDRQQGPSTYLIITGSAFIGFFLIAVWVLSAPAPVPERSGGTALSTEDTKGRVTNLDTTPSNVPDSSSEDEAVKDSPAEATEQSDTTTYQDTVKDSPIEDAVQSDTPAKEDSMQDSRSENIETSDTSAKQVSEPVVSDAEKEESPSPQDTVPDNKEDSGKTDEETVQPGDVKLPDTISSQVELTTENKEVNTTEFETQVQESKEEKVIQNDGESKESSTTELTPTQEKIDDAAEVPSEWKLCDFKGAQDYIPCLDNTKAVKKLSTTAHYEHRERHCPKQDELPKCLIPLPKGYKTPIGWPDSRDQIWFNNVPHTELVTYKSDQNWVKVSQDKRKLIFPGGGTQFKTEHGASRYRDYIEKIVPDISWGKNVRVVLDVGCGVASFGGYLFDKDVLTMSLAPKDEHEAQVQFALERGIPAISAVMGTQRLVFPSNVFDVVHCARCRVPWEKDDGMLLLELNRLLRPGGFFVWSATPVYWDNAEDTKIWKETIDLVERMQWTLLKRDINPETKVGVAIFQKPKDNDLYNLRKEDALPPFCAPDDKPDAAWYIPMKACMHKIPTGEGARGTSWPVRWPLRVEATPAWLSTSEKGIYGKPVAEDYRLDTVHWKRVVAKSYMEGLGIDWNKIRKVMDMKAGYGGFAAALVSYPLWVMNIVPVTEPDTLPIVFDRGFLGMYHDWCEPHSTYPRSYDLMHSDHLLSTLTNRCRLVTVVMEMDRILRPDGWAIIRDQKEVLIKVESILRSLHWDIVLSFNKDDEELIVAQKKFWRPEASS